MGRYRRRAGPGRQGGRRHCGRLLSAACPTCGAPAPADAAPTVIVRGRDGRGTDISLADLPVGKWTRVTIATSMLPK